MADQKLKNRVAANRAAKKKRLFADGGMAGADDAPYDPQTQAGMSFDPEKGIKTLEMVTGEGKMGKSFANPAEQEPTLAEPTVDPVANAVFFGPSLVKGAARMAAPTLGRLAADEAGSVPLSKGSNELVHYSQAADPLTEINPDFMGTGKQEAEGSRAKGMLARSYYYEAGTQPESIVADTARHAHYVDRPTNILDLNSEEAMPFREAATDMNDLENRLDDAGYAGYKNSAHPTVPHAVALFDTQPVKRSAPVIGGRVHEVEQQAEVPMFSQLEKTVNDKIRQKMPSSYARSTLLNSGVTKEEMEVYGVDDFLKNNEHVTPEALKAHIEENRPDLGKHVYGEAEKKGGSKYADDGEYSPENLHIDFEPSRQDYAEHFQGSRHEDAFHDAESEQRLEDMAGDSENPRNKFSPEERVDDETGETKHVIDFGRDRYSAGWGTTKKVYTGEMEFESVSEAQEALDSVAERWEEHYDDDRHDISGTYDEHRAASDAELDEEAHQRYLAENSTEEAPATATPVSRGLPQPAPVGEPKYASYRLAGGKNYQEELYTGPSKTKLQTDRDVQALEAALAKKAGNFSSEFTSSDAESPELRKYVDTLRDSKKPEDKAAVAAYEKVMPAWKQTVEDTLKDQRAEYGKLTTKIEEIDHRYRLQKTAIDKEYSDKRQALYKQCGAEIEKLKPAETDKITESIQGLYDARNDREVAVFTDKEREQITKLRNSRYALEEDLSEKRQDVQKHYRELGRKADEETEAAQRKLNDAQLREADSLMTARDKLDQAMQDLRGSLEPKNPNYTASHFGGTKPNVFAHARTTERDLVNGGSSLNVEEIQSDAHQEARDLGYLGSAKKAYEGPTFSSTEMDDHVNKMQTKLNKYMEENGLTDRGEGIAQAQNAGLFPASDVEKLQSIQKYKAHQANPQGIPEMVMAKSWEKHGFKRMLKKAVDMDKDYLTWNTGEISAKNNGTTGEAVKGQIFNYDEKYPGIIKKLIRDLDSSIKVEKVPAKGGDEGTAELWGIKLTPKLKAALRKKGFSNFAVGGMVGGGAAATQRYAEGGEITGYTPDEGTVSGIAPQAVIGAPVNMLDPEGQLQGVNPEQVAEALDAGYTHAPDEVVQAHFEQQKYGTAGQQAATGAEGALSGVIGSTLGAGLETKFLGVDPAGIRGREAANPWTHGVSSVAGFGAGMFTGTGEAQVLAKAGRLIPGAAKGASFVAKVGADAAKAAFEGVLYQMDQEGGKLFKENPEQSASHAIADIGLSGVMAGVFGGAIGGLLRKTGLHPDMATAPGIPEGEPAAFVPGIDKAAYEAGDLKTHIEVDPAIPASKKQKLMEAFNLKKQKENAKEIIGAQTELGAPETPGMTLANPMIQMQVDSLAHSPYTYSGNKIRGQLDEAYDVATGALKKATESANGRSRDELGQVLQSSITDETRTAYAPVKAAFDAVAELHPNAPVLPEDVVAFKKAVAGVKEMAVGPSTDEGKLARQVLKSVQMAKTAEDFSTFRNQAALKDLGTFQTKDPLAFAKGKLRGILSDLQEDVVDRYSKSFPRNDEAGAMMAASIDMNKAAKQAYAPYIKKLGTLFEWMGKGKINGTEDALRFVKESLSSTDVAKKLFSASKDPQFLRYFSKEWPEQFKMVRDYQRMDMLESSSRAGEFSPKTFFKKFNDLEPEIKNSLYSPEEIKKINAADTYINHAFPKDFNPSHSSHGIAFKDAHASPKGMLLANARDLAMEKIIKAAGGSPQTESAVALAKATVAGDKLATRAIKSVFNGVKEAPMGALIPLASHRDKLSRLVDTYKADPSKMFGQNDSNPIPEYAQAFSATTGRAVQYLGAMKPNTTPAAPMDSKLPPSSTQMAAYNRALDIAQQPLNVLARMKQGTLTPQDITTLKTIYPQMYDSISRKIMTQVVDNAHKGKMVQYTTRLQLSMFLGQPLDSTMTQPAMSSIQAQAQSTKQAAAQQQIPSKPPSASSTKSLKGMAEQAQTPRQSREAARAKRTD